jgi:hypothetical protein
MQVWTVVLGKIASIASGKPLEPVDTADQDVLDPALLEIWEDLHPELRALGLFQPHPEHVALAVEGDPEREVARAALHAAAFADLQHHAVQKHDRVDVFQRPLGPVADVVHDRVGHAADQITPDVHPVDLVQVRLDIARGEPAGVQREDLLVKSLEATLRTIFGSKLPLRSRGVSISTGPLSVTSVFGVEPLRVFPAPPGGS